MGQGQRLGKWAEMTLAFVGAARRPRSVVEPQHFITKIDIVIRGEKCLKLIFNGVTEFGIQ